MVQLPGHFLSAHSLSPKTAANRGSRTLYGEPIRSSLPTPHISRPIALHSVFSFQKNLADILVTFW